MPSTDQQGSSVPFASFRRAILGIRNDQVHSLEMNQESDSPDLELESFQKLVYDRFYDLSTVAADEFLTARWIMKVLEAFVGCQEEFRVILCNRGAWLSKPPLDKFVSDFFEKSIKALDICNATREGIEKIRLWQKQLEIVLCALGSQQRMIGEGQFRRARKALMDLALLMLDDKETGYSVSHRNRSFGRHNTSRDHHRHRSGHSRSLSWSVSHSWSAAKQLQSFANNLAPPRANEIVATNGLAVPVFTMSFVLMFVLWILVAAIPCQDRSLQIHFSIPRQYPWGAPLLLLHDRVMDEAKKRDRRNSSVLLKEVYEIDKCIRHMSDLVDSVHIPLTEQQKEELQKGVQELAVAFDACKNGLDPLEPEVREVFRKIMSCRIEGLELFNRGSPAG
ncbi:protein ROH1-like [Diospyros lotus]|uniref:protein ROH1-like n=1 Tax=Diospyros lotus TaxID=55363 RepID=UPI0022586796|nr:protein ROH1-like [Diospyros lotus]XP_052206036.1 protein ROH1-like [Diospyros lotus]XP_052206037.1 protein ROH1-like [Diospyros lotus]XP_052206038.1 protein ROH1-like [Diospyros lotus]